MAAYKAGARYSKEGNGYKEDPKGKYMYKGGKMIGMDQPGDKPGEGDDMAHPHKHGRSGSRQEGAKKSEVNVDDLEKSLEQLEAITQAGDVVSRKEELLAKAQESELSDDENEELIKALRGETDKGDTDAEPGTGEQISKGLKDNDEIVKAIDVSGYLQEQHQELVKSLETVGERIDANANRQHEFDLVYARALHQMGSLIKSMSERLGIIERQPAAQPKSRGVNKPAAGNVVEKSFAGEPPAGEELSKMEIVDTLGDMFEKSIDEGRGGMSKSNVNLELATAKYEQTMRINPKLLEEVRQFREQNGGNSH